MNPTMAKKSHVKNLKRLKINIKSSVLKLIIALFPRGEAKIKEIDRF